MEVGDEEKRLEFCYWLQGEYLNCPNFFNEILFSDEASFSRNGMNLSLNSQKNNVCCGIVKDKTFGPFFFEGNVNGNVLNFLEKEFWNALHDLPLQSLLIRWKFSS